MFAELQYGLIHTAFPLGYRELSENSWSMPAGLLVAFVHACTTLALSPAVLSVQCPDFNFSSCSSLIFSTARTEQQLLLELLVWQVGTTGKHGPAKAPLMRTCIPRMLSLIWMTKMVFIAPHWRGNLPKRGPFGWERALSKGHMVLRRWRKVRVRSH